MTGLSALSRHPKRALAVLAGLLGAAGAVLGSGAVFTAKAVNPNNTFTSGALTVANSQPDAAILTAADLPPGGGTQGTVDIRNTGTVAGTLKLSRAALSDSDPANPLSTQLDLVIRDCGNFSDGTPACEAADPVLYTGRLAAMTSPSELGTFLPDEQHRYEFKIRLRPDAGNEFQGDHTTATFRWDAFQ